jgi:hypothetical protein
LQIVKNGRKFAVLGVFSIEKPNEFARFSWRILLFPNNLALFRTLGTSSAKVYVTANDMKNPLTESMKVKTNERRAMKKKYAWKFLVWNETEKRIESNYDNSPWRIGKWRTVADPTVECVGLNCSQTVDQAYSFVQGGIVAKVEYGGKVIATSDKLTCQKMRIVKAWYFTAQASAEYEKVKAQAWAEYEKVTDQASAEYEKVKAPALAEYEKVTAPAWSKILRTLKRV